MVCNVLVPYDGSSLAQRAVPVAVGLAKASEGRVVLVRATSPDFDALFAAEADAQALAHRIRRSGVPVTVRVRSGTPLKIVTEECTTWQPDWVVLASHGQSGAGRWVYGSVADQLLRHATAPVVLVPVGQDPRWPDGRRVRLLVPLDGSPAADAIVPVAGRLTHLLDATVMLLRVVEPPIPSPYAYDQCAPYVEFDAHQELTLARAYLRKVADGLKLRPGRAECHAVVGYPGVSIPRLAREQRVDLVVLARGGAGATAKTLGSAALGTVQLAGVPIVLVPLPARSRVRATSLGRGASHETQSDAAAPAVAGAAPEGIAPGPEWSDSDEAGPPGTPVPETPKPESVPA